MAQACTLRRSRRVQKKEPLVEEEDQEVFQRNFFSINQDVDNYEDSPTFLENNEGKNCN